MGTKSNKGNVRVSKPVKQYVSNFPRVIIGGHNKADTEFLKGNDKALLNILQR